MYSLEQACRKKSIQLKTGQTIEYGSGTGFDDGFFEKGMARAYTVLTTGQYSGSTNITINAKTDVHSNNCVYDNNTLLMWSRNAVNASVGPTSNGFLPWTTNGSNEGIFTYVAAANAAGLSGYSDWRIPNYLEFFSLVDVVTIVPDSVAFPAWPGAVMWTSTTRNAVTANAYTFSFSNGIHSFAVKTTTLYTALVRGGM